MFLKKKIVLIISLSFLLSPSLWGGEGPLTLEGAIQKVLASNPDVQAAHLRASAARERVPQAKALEDPMVGVMFEDVPIDTIDINRGEEINYRIEQNIPFPGKRYIRGKEARFDADVTKEETKGNILDVLLDLKRTYYTLYRIDRQREINRENQRLLRQLLGSAETSYAAGQTTADTPLKAGVELSKLKNEELLLDQERTAHQSHLRALLNQPSHEEILLPSRLPWPHLTASLKEIEETTFESRPELKALKVMEKRDKAKLTAAKQSLIPDFSLGFEYNQRPGQQDAWTGTAMINLPIFFWGKNRAEIREAKASLKATEAERRSMEIHSSHEIDSAYSAVKSAEKLISSYRKGLLPQAKTTLETARLAYTSGKVDFLTLIDAARTYKDLQSSFYENEARLGIAFAELERLVGKELKE